MTGTNIAETILTMAREEYNDMGQADHMLYGDPMQYIQYVCGREGVDFEEIADDIYEMLED